MPHYIQKLTLKSILVLLVLPFTAAAEPSSSQPEMLADAGLADVFFLDVDRGWCVGDRGVILLTTDGGRQWHLADSPVNCRLESVCFVDGEHGWAVGGWSKPYSKQTSGVILRTDNGGRSWERVDQPTLPRLQCVRFQDRHQGWAVGDASPMYPAGFFRTQDGGQRWTPVPANQWRDWADADDGGSGYPLAVGGSHVAKLASRNRVNRYALAGIGARQARAVSVAGPAESWVVGDGGLVLHSGDHGMTWQAPPGLPAHPIDFRAVATHGERIWIVGEPGSCVVTSDDKGVTWSVQETGQNVPLKALRFVDPQHGWAVGELGTILATRDGGRTWLRQRGMRRLAVFGVFSRADQVPLEMIAQLAGNEGYLAAVEVVVDERSGLGDGRSNSSRVREAILDVGGSTGQTDWRFPLQQARTAFTSAEAIVADWDMATGMDSLALLEQLLVARIRQWRPAILVTQHPGQAEASPLNYLVGQTVLSAARKAADPTCYPEQISGFGLATWQVEKLFAVSDAATGGGIELDTSRLATRLGRTLRDYTSAAAGLLHPDWKPPEDSLVFELLVSELPRDLASRGFMRGVSLGAGEEGRRALGPPVAANLQAVTAATRKEQYVQQLLRQAASRSDGATSWLGQIDDLLAQLSPTAGGNALFQLAQHYRQAGQFDLAEDTLKHLIRTYPSHSLADSSLLWLLRYQTSAEVRWGLLKRLPKPSTSPPPASHPSGVVLASAAIPVGPTAGEIIQGSRPTLVSDPPIRLCLASRENHAGSKRKALHHYRQLSASQALGDWSRAARGELWLAERKGLSPKPLLRAVTTKVRPVLDGVLDEPFWEESEILNLASPQRDDQHWKAAVQIARDAEYLYWAIACRRPKTQLPADLPAAENDAPRRRDADLSARDRVELLIDVDRDYNSYYRFVVDDRGWAGEDCFGSSLWDPEWFVAARSDPQHWTIEAAIPLEVLVPSTPPSGEVWGIGVQRIVPGTGFQSWTRPASPQVRPEGFGYLRF